MSLTEDVFIFVQRLLHEFKITQNTQNSLMSGGLPIYLAIGPYEIQIDFFLAWCVDA